MVVEILQITAEQARRQLFVALELAHNLLSPSSRLARQKTRELAVSLVRARSGQIPSKLSLSKNIENGPRSLRNCQFCSTELSSGEFWKNDSSPDARCSLIEVQSADLKRWMVRGFFLFCLARMLALTMTRSSWSLMPGPVVQLVISLGRDENTKSRMFFFPSGFQVQLI